MADERPDPLVGDKSVAELTKLIHETMPDDADDKCSADDSAKVAAYIFDAFYSPAAQNRGKIAHVELARLTVRQYRNAAPISSAAFASRRNGQPNVVCVLNTSIRANSEDNALAIKRVDPEVNFDWGDSTPDAKQLDKQKFCIQWNGSLLAPDTGEYEFVVRSQHAVRFTINRGAQPGFVDAWVESGDEIEHGGTIWLLGGRPYPIKLEFCRGQQGVSEKNKDYKQKYKPSDNTSISLQWKRPNHTLDRVRGTCRPTKAPPVFVLATRFPPDDRGAGYGAARRSRKSGTKPRPTRHWRRPVTWPSTCSTSRA